MQKPVASRLPRLSFCILHSAFCIALAASAAIADTIPATAYIQDGLVVQYDGIENAGPGVHADDITAWKDLTGNGHDLPLNAGDTVFSDHVNIAKASRTASNDVFAAYSPITIEFNARPTEMNTTTYDSSIANIPYIGAFGWDGRSGAISVKRPQSETANNYTYRTYNSGYTKLADLISSGVYKSYTAIPGYGNTSAADSPVYVNGTKVTKPSGGLNWGGNTRSSSLKLSVGYTSTASDVRAIRIYGRALTATEIAINVAVDKIRFEGAALSVIPAGWHYNETLGRVVPDGTETALSVAGVPEGFGAPVPPYGVTNGLAAGATFNVSAPAWTNEAGTVAATCTGWRLYDYLGNVVTNGTENAFSYVHPSPAAYRRLEWRWDVFYKIDASAGTRGTVSPAVQWVAAGSNATVTATANSGYDFTRWTGDVPSGANAADTTITFPAVTAPASLTAVFNGVLHVSPDGDGTDPLAGFATGYSNIQTAINAANDGDIVLLDTKTFNLTSQLSIGKAIVLSGAGEKEETVLDAGNADRRITVSAAGATLKNFTFTRMGGANSGSIGIKMSANSTLTNLVARQNGNAHTGSANCRYTFDISAGRMTGCVVTNNWAGEAPGVILSGGTVENCYFADNRNRGLASSHYEAVAVRVTGGATVRNCTFVGNRGDWGAVRVTNKGAKIYNNIIWGNYSKDGTVLCDWVDTVGNATWINNCTSDADTLRGTVSGNISDDPLLQADNLHFFATSPCNGAAAPAYAPALDMEGNPRGATPSIGCVEYVAAAGLACTISASAESVLQPSTATLTVSFDGAYTEPLSYAWDFFGTGATDSTAASPVLSDIGVYTPSVTVTDAQGRTATASYGNEIIIYGASGDCFVTNGVNPSARPPYATWETAATNLANVLHYCRAGGRAVLSDGMHQLTSQISVSKAMTVTSLHGRDATFLTKAGADTSRRMFLIDHPSAVVEGVTITNCTFNNQGRGSCIWICNGRLRDCRVIDCHANGWGMIQTEGGSSGARISRCIVENCDQMGCGNNQTANAFRLEGTNPVLENSLVRNVSSFSTSASYAGAALYVGNKSAVVRNCTFADNTSHMGSPVHILSGAAGAVLENCILSGNHTNTASSATATPILHDCNDPLMDGTTRMSASYLRNSCLWPSSLDYSGHTSVLVADPQFRSRARGDLHIRSSSPCRDTGRGASIAAGAVDLDGLPRIFGKAVDMGCYESFAKPGTFLFVK